MSESMTETADFARDCKTDERFNLTAVAHCIVAGVKYSPGDTFQTVRAHRDYLMAQGAVMQEPDPESSDATSRDTPANTPSPARERASAARRTRQQASDDPQ